MENKIKKAFEPVKADAKLKADVKYYLSQNTDGDKPQKRNYSHGRKKAAIIITAACLILAFTSIFQMQTLYAQAAYVELTGPTELGISLNGKNEVIKVVGLNDSGKMIADAVDVKHMPYEKALDMIMDCDAYRENADMQMDVDVNVECDNHKYTEVIEQETQNVCQRHQERCGQTQNQSPEQIEEQTEEHQNKSQGQHHNQDWEMDNNDLPHE